MEEEMEADELTMVHVKGRYWYSTLDIDNGQILLVRLTGDNMGLPCPIDDVRIVEGQERVDTEFLAECWNVN